MQNARKLITLLFLGSLSVLFFVFYPRSAKQVERSREQLYSYLVGHELCRQLREYQPNHTLADVIDGMRAYDAGLPLPDNMTCEQKAQFLNQMENELFHAWLQKNQTDAERYLLSIDQQACSTPIVPSRLYYQVLQEGTGTDLLLPDSTALFHYTITTMDGKEVFSTRGQDPKQVDLSDAIPGFSLAVVGMRQHERRKIFVHPDLAYRSTSWHVPPQSLLIIEVELVSKISVKAF